LSTEREQAQSQPTKTMTNTLTSLESQVLNFLHTTGWYNWDCEPHYSDVDASDVCQNTGIDKASIGGVLGSLSKKGLIYLDYCDVNTIEQAFITSTDETYEFFGESDLLD
jgi:DNA-binding MarR family transcriptional regulator